MSEIRTISQGNYILQGTVATSAGIVGDGTTQNPLRADETVLWENTSEYPIVSDITLSEKWSNFKYIRVDTAELYANANKCDLFDTASYTLAGTRVKRFIVGHYAPDPDTSTLYIRYIRLSFANNNYINATIDTARTNLPNNGSITFTSSDSSTRLVRVVGINRIAG